MLAKPTRFYHPLPNPPLPLSWLFVHHILRMKYKVEWPLIKLFIFMNVFKVNILYNFIFHLYLNLIRISPPLCKSQKKVNYKKAQWVFGINPRRIKSWNKTSSQCLNEMVLFSLGGNLPGGKLDWREYALVGFFWMESEFAGKLIHT